MQAGDLEIEVRQIGAAVVHEHLRVEVVVKRAELRLHQTECPRDQAVGRRTAGAQWDAVLFTELSDVVGDQQ